MKNVVETNWWTRPLHDKPVASIGTLFQGKCIIFVFQEVWTPSYYLNSLSWYNPQMYSPKTHSGHNSSGEHSSLTLKVLLAHICTLNFQLPTSLLAMSLRDRFCGSRKGRDKGRWAGTKGYKQHGCVWECLLLTLGRPFLSSFAQMDLENGASAL